MPKKEVLFALVALMGLLHLIYLVVIHWLRGRKRERILLSRNEALKMEVEIREQNERDLQNTLLHRQKTEKQLIESERLLMTGRMARSIAHEVRNPLTNLHLALEHLKNEIPSDIEGITLYTDIMHRNLHRIEHLVEQMLNSSEPKELRTVPTDINRLLEDTIVFTLDRLNLHGTSLEKSLAENLPPISIDQEQVKLALLNIIINAIEAMEENKGHLFISTYMLKHHLFIEIKDNGIGIGPQEMDRLFEPFFTAKPSGLGLGLTAAKNILNSHQASIQVVSEQHTGTTFTIIFKYPLCP